MSKILRLISIILLFLAVEALPYSYYQFLRWVISGTSFYTGWLYYQTKHDMWLNYPFFVIGILFNPIASFFLDKGIWSTIDIVVAIFFIFSLTKKVEKNTEISK